MPAVSKDAARAVAQAWPWFETPALTKRAERVKISVQSYLVPDVFVPPHAVLPIVGDSFFCMACIPETDLHEVG